MEEIEFTRTELYDLVWSEPLSRLARKYNISDNGIRKICKKHNIPLPVMGHWQKVQYGYKVTKTKLPENSKSTGKIMLCYRDENGKYVYPGKLRKAAIKEVLIGKNVQKNQSSAEQIDHPSGIFQMAYGKAFKLQVTTDQKPRREVVN